MKNCVVSRWDDPKEINSRLYTSLADTPEIIDDALCRFEEVFKHVKKADKGLI